MSSDKYNGWSNRETWLVNLWIENDERNYNYWQDQASEIHSRKSATAVGCLAEQLHEEITESMPDLGATLASDLLNAALGEVDWHEIAKNMLNPLDGYEE